MQDKIVIYLHAHETTKPSWVVLDAACKVRYEVIAGQPDELSQAALNKEVIVIVPAEDVLLVSVKLPKMNRARLLEALPYSLEENLTVDVETLHFAPADTQPDGELPVAVVANTKMQQWIELLKSWQIEANKLLPFIFSLPVEDNTWHIVLADTAIVRIGKYQGFACDINNLNTMLSAALSNATSAPGFLHFHRVANNAYTPSINASVTIKEETIDRSQLYRDLAQYAIESPSINLLQRAYRSKKSRFPQMQRLWKAVSYLAIAWVLLLLLYPTMSYFILSRRVNNLHDQMAQIYKRHFPNSKMVSPRQQMENKLQQASSQMGDSKLFVLIDYVGKAVMESPVIKLKRLDFQNKQLTIDLDAPSSDDFAKFTGSLEKQGLKVNQQHADLAGTRINATIIVE